MATRTDAYVDTSGFIAFVDQSDSFHPLFRRLFSTPPRLVTTSLVVAEGHAWFLKRYDRTRALVFLAMLKEMVFLKTLGVGKSEIEAGSALLRKFSDQSLTVADAVGLVVMREQGSRVCWATDHHLGLTGVPLVIHSW
jgi:predicted nucleic acid-binding protein